MPEFAGLDVPPCSRCKNVDNLRYFRWEPSVPEPTLGTLQSPTLRANRRTQAQVLFECQADGRLSLVDVGQDWEPPFAWL